MNQREFAEIIPVAQLKHGSYYVGICRNACIARWNEEEQQFYHWREKMGDIFTEEIRHLSYDTKFDVFCPMRLLENPRFEIPFLGRVKGIGCKFLGNSKDLREFDKEVWNKDVAGY